MHAPHSNSTDEQKPATSIIFVIDPPALTIQSILLVASVRKHLPLADLIAYCPSEKAKDLPPQMVEFFNATNTQLKYMDTEGTFSPRYKQGNKLIAATQHRPNKHSIFLDTDVVFWQHFDLDSMVSPNTVSAAPEGRYTWGKPAGHWEQAYSVFGLSVPEGRIKLARSGAVSPPYFNAGVVGFPQEFAEVWLETAKELDDPKHNIPRRRPWLDQIALPVAIERSGMKYRVLDDRYNLSLTHRNITPQLAPHLAKKAQKEIDRLNNVDPFILHYHQAGAPKGLRYEGYLDSLIRTWTVFDAVSDAHWRQELDFNPGEIMSEFHQLKKIRRQERTEDQKKRFQEVDDMKRRIQKLKHSPKSLELFWPESILRSDRGGMVYAAK